MKQVKCFLTVLAITLFISSVVFAQDPALVVTEEGKVGIGTNAPLWPLHILSDIAFGTASVLQNTSAGGNTWTTFSTGDAIALVNDIGGILASPSPTSSPCVLT